MDIFTQNRLLYRALIFFIGLNLLCLFFLWKTSKTEQAPKKSVEEVSKILTKELNLSPEQGLALQKLRSDFFSKESILSQLIRAQRDSMNMEMFKAQTDTNAVKRIARCVAENEYHMEIYRLEQAQQLKTICTPEQMQRFEGLGKEIRDYFKPEKK